jgi:arylsulfatase A-like enzyme
MAMLMQLLMLHVIRTTPRAQLTASLLAALAWGFVTSALAAAATQTPPAPPVQRPNILFIFADDQRADTLGALGNPVIRTPAIDRLVRRGVSFRQAYMQGGLQGATCVPSRAMLLSGQSLFRVDEQLSRTDTWPEAFARAGYTTFISGKWHNGAKSLPRVFQHARGMFLGGMTNPLNAKLSEVIDGVIQPGKPSTRHHCEVIADHVIDFLKGHKDGPFLCFMPLDAPHDPHIVPPDYALSYPADDPRFVPANFLPQHPFNNGEMSIRDEKLLPWPRTREAVGRMNSEYARYVTYLDSHVGRVLDALDASPHAGNTLVVFAADSGVARGSHGLIGKQNLYEHSVRVPLIVAGPGLPRDQRTDARVYLFDLMPTLGALTAVPPPRGSEGRDFSDSLRDPQKPGRERLFFAYRDVQRAIRDERWKLIRYPKVDRTQLFDLANDPQEMRDLAREPAQADRVKELLATLQVEQRLFGDPALLTVAEPQPAEWTPPSAAQEDSSKPKGKKKAGQGPEDGE